MSNPVVTIGNYIPVPSDPQVVRKTYSKIVYDDQDFFVYAEGEYDPFYVTFNPSDKGQRFFIFVPLEDALSSVKPDFVSQESWDETVKLAPSAFVVPVLNSVMPKLMIPSSILVDNGIKTPLKSMWAFDDTLSKDLFNWEIVTFNGDVVPSAESYDFWHDGGVHGAQYVSVNAKNDQDADNVLVVKLENPAVPPTGNWLKTDSSDLVVGGAFCLLLNVTPSTAGTAPPNQSQDNPWSLTFEFGDVTMQMNQTGALQAKIDPEDNWTTANLGAGKAKEGPPQQEYIEGKEPYIIVVFPVWNGLVLVNGVQDSRASVDSTTTFVRKLKAAGMLKQPYSDGFDPTAPAAVEVGMGSGATSVLTDFGTTMTVTAKNCGFELAYLPVFFSKNAWFDEWIVTADNNPGVVEYDFNVYPIWTKNGTASLLSPSPSVIESIFTGPLSGTHYSYVKWRLWQTQHNRFGGQIFGSVYEVIETRDFPVRNNNGNFDLLWIGGTPADPSPLGSWKDYIQSVTVSVGLDGSNGSITVDKYGIAGQHAEAIQSIGAVTIIAAGGDGTVAGSVFQGLGMGTNDSKSTGGATWTVPLVGLEKKLDDIMLVNVPFFDGERVRTVLEFLAKYSGIIVDFSYAPNSTNHRLSASEDISVARFNWKSGTTVRSAIEDVMDDALYNYVVRDGRIYFYELNNTGLPVWLGPDRSVAYPDTKVMTVERQYDFNDIRNEIVVLGLQAVTSGQGTKIDGIPTFPRIELRRSTTTPSIPWARSVVKGLPGFLTVQQISDSADRLQAMSRTYMVTGTTTIAGNAQIKPYDRWGGFIISSVTHNIDIQGKSWTTDIEMYLNA